MVEVGNGGPGIEIDITGSKKYYAAGGGGGTSNTNVNKVVGGTGGSGIGGKGYSNNQKEPLYSDVLINTHINSSDMINRVFANIRNSSKLMDNKSFGHYVGKPVYIYESNEKGRKNRIYSLEYIYDRIYINNIMFQKIETDYIARTNQYHSEIFYLKNFNGEFKSRIYNINISSDHIYNGKPNTGSGGGGGGTLRDETTTANEKNANDAAHNSASGAGGSGVVVIRYKQIFAKEYLKAFDEYRYYALVVDKLTGLGTSVKISELEFYKVPKTSQINSSTDFYSELLSPEIEIVGEAKEAVDAANKAYEDQKKLETDNAKKIQDLKDLLAGLGEDDLDWSAIDKNKSDREELLKLISQYETKMITEATNKAAYEAHLASQKLISAEIRLEEAQLQTHIDALNSIKTRIQQLQDEIGGAENTHLLEEQEAELLKTKTENEAANAELEQAKIKEQADKLLLLKEQKISKDLANELAIVKSQLSDAQKELDNALYVKNNIRNIMDVVSQTEQELVAERIARATAEVRKLNQITMTEEARIRAEAQLRIEQERKQHLIDRENDFTLLTNQSDANQAKIQLLNDKISDINEYLLDPSGYTLRYLENSSVEFAQLELEKLQLDLEISEIRSKIDDFISKMGENARLTNEYRRQNVNIQKELDNQVQENIGWKLKTDNYKFAAENALSVEKSIYDVQTKISFNMESTMTTIANSIIVTAYDKELYDFSDRNEKSKLLSIKSVDDVNEQKRNNKISKATIKLVLNVFILSVALVMLHLNFSIFNMMSIIIIVYVIIFALYAIEVASIVHTRTDQKYWKKPDIAKLK